MRRGVPESFIGDSPAGSPPYRRRVSEDLEISQVRRADRVRGGCLRPTRSRISPTQPLLERPVGELSHCGFDVALESVGRSAGDGEPPSAGTRRVVPVRVDARVDARPSREYRSTMESE